ncbi:hypothetical protein JXA70_05030 [candidate division KSB1 bacterium]|nr:hypothetical protein [candidate division KSB1 bacterium]
MSHAIFIIMFLKRWHKSFGSKFWPIFIFGLLVIFEILLDFPGRSAGFRNAFWLRGDGFSISIIFTFYVPVILLGLCIVLILVDLFAYCFKRLDNFTNTDDWYIASKMKWVKKNPPANEKDAAKIEMDIMKELSYEVKYLMLKLSLRFLFVMSIFIISFAEIYTFINRFSYYPPAYENISWNACLPWHIFYSLDVITTLGGAAPTPHVDNLAIWWASGLQLAFSIVITILFLTLAITSIFETFNLKTSYIPAFVKYHLEESKNKAA